MDTRAFGLAGCITPSGIPYVSTRGGPLSGLEALSLQGLPLDRLLLSKESQKELQDLAGNAMSSTVVGSAVLAALIVGHKILRKGTAMCADVDDDPLDEKRLPRVPDDMQLAEFDLEHSDAGNVDVEALKAEAGRSARYCKCEGQTIVRTRDVRDPEYHIVKCKKCGHTGCKKCTGNPPHEFERFDKLERTDPLEFAKKLKSILPVRLAFSGISSSDFEIFGREMIEQCGAKEWRKLLDTISCAVGDRLCFFDLKRTEYWTVIYDGPHSTLKLLIRTDSIQWFFYAKPSSTEPTISLQREILSKPIARMTPAGSSSLLDGEWEICSPLSSKSVVQISGIGEQVPSFESRCGLQDRCFVEGRVWPTLKVESTENLDHLDVDIRGVYTLLPDCGTAQGCLHKKEAAVPARSPPVYLFLDPTKLGEPAKDSFVFALDHERISGYDSRVIVAELSCRWRTSRVSGNEKDVDIYFRRWIKNRTAALRAFLPKSPILCRAVQPGSSLASLRSENCHQANIAFLSFALPASEVPPSWEQGAWQITDVTSSTATLQSLSWLIQKAADLTGCNEWQQVTKGTASDSDSQLPSYSVEKACTTCAPPKPGILWGRDKRNRVKAYEDPQGAAVYERHIKARPSPFLIFRHIDEQGNGHLKVALNLQTLFHRAHEKLIGNSKNADPVLRTWRLLSSAPDKRDFKFDKFRLERSAGNPLAPQPPHFNPQLGLRDEQRRSLYWMKSREADDVEPFAEEEVEEALLPLMQWRAEGKVVREKTVRGGVLSDEVGYGKTALILGLIDSMFAVDSERVSPPEKGLVDTNATLIVVPAIMIDQWAAETVKFLGKESDKNARPRDAYMKVGNRYNVLVIGTLKALISKSIEEIRSADIILVSWSIFVNSSSYYKRLEKLTGAPQVPLKGSRNFDHWFEDTLNRLETIVDTLVSDGPETMLERIKENREQVKKDHAYFKYCPSERRKGHAASSAASELSGTGGGGSWDDKKFHHSQDKGWNDRKEFNIVKGNKTGPVDWTSVRGVPLHMFRFTRLVIDEFTYANQEQLIPLLSLKSRFKWILSGTPPLNNFADVNTIAPFLGVHLGVDDDEAGRVQNSRLLRKDGSGK